VTEKTANSFRVSRRQALVIFAVPIAAAALPALAHAAPTAGASATPSQSPMTVGYLYVNLNTAGANAVAGFARNSDGTISPLPGSPFAVGGAGSSSSLSSQGALQLSSNRRYLLAVDAGSNQISVLRMGKDGSLAPLEGSPFGSGGRYPVSIAVAKDLVYVANQGNGGSNYTGFNFDSKGNLTPIAGSAVSLLDGSGVGDVLIDSKGRILVGTRVGTSLIDSFAIDKSGLLQAAPTSPLKAQGLGPLGSAFRDGKPLQLFVSNAHDGAFNGTISSFSVASDGSLTALGSSPYPDFQTAPCWVALSPDNKFLFTANTASGSISSYPVAADGSLGLVATTPLRGAPGLGAIDLKLDPTGNYLYVVANNIGAVSVLAVVGGAMTELTDSPFLLPAGGKPFGIAIA
jgi:6-phosphogluconolactonase